MYQNRHAKSLRGLSIAVVVLSGLSIFVVVIVMAILLASGSFINQIGPSNLDYYLRTGTSLPYYGIDGNAVLGVIDVFLLISQISLGWALITSVLTLIAGIIGIRNAAMPERLKSVMVWAIVGAVAAGLSGSLISMILLIIVAVFAGSDRNQMQSNETYQHGYNDGLMYAQQAQQAQQVAQAQQAQRVAQAQQAQQVAIPDPMAAYQQTYGYAPQPANMPPEQPIEPYANPVILQTEVIDEAPDSDLAAEVVEDTNAVATEVVESMNTEINADEMQIPDVDIAPDAVIEEVRSEVAMGDIAQEEAAENAAAVAEAEHGYAFEGESEDLIESAEDIVIEDSEE